MHACNTAAAFLTVLVADPADSICSLLVRIESSRAESGLACAQSVKQRASTYSDTLAALLLACRE